MFVIMGCGMVECCKMASSHLEPVSTCCCCTSGRPHMRSGGEVKEEG